MYDRKRHRHFEGMVRALRSARKVRAIIDKPLFYILDEENRVVGATINEFGEFMENRNKVVCRTDYPCGVVLSTVFLGVPHGEDRYGRKLLFETAMFDRNGFLSEENDRLIGRVATWSEAENLHAETHGKLLLLIKSIETERERERKKAVRFGEASKLKW